MRKSKYILYSACLLTMLGQVDKLTAQEKSDSLTLRSGYENAFDYLLQKPVKNEKFPDKNFGDHFFLMGGVGLNWLGADGSSPAMQVSIMAGDWLTPVHGVRAGVKVGQIDYGTGKNKIAGMEVSYLLNLTALQQASYSLQRTFELSFLAGVEGIYARELGTSQWGGGVHTGFLGTFRLSNLTYVYLEPRVTFYSNGITPLADPSWRKYKFAGSMNVGLAYRLLSGDYRGSDKYSNQSGDDNMFISIGIGTGTPLQKSFKKTMKNLGLTGSVAIGKEVNAYSTFRGKLRLGYYPIDREQELKAASAQVDYLFNLTNLMGGYRDDRNFWLNGVAGVELAASHYKGTKFSPGIGAGVQLNFRTGERSNFYIEPRVDIYREKFEPTRNFLFSKYDVLPTLEAGLTFYHRERNDGRISDVLFENKSFWDHLFVQGGIGISSAATTRDFRPEPTVYIGIGRWLNAYSGLRLAAEIRKYKSYPTDKRKNLANGGIDYLFNFTNFMGGYDPYRRFEFIGAAGVRMAVKSEQRHIYPGVHIGVQGLYHLNPMTGIFVEPSVQSYSSNLVDAGLHVVGMGFLGGITAGVNLRMQGYDVHQNRVQYKNNDDARNSFLYAAVGPSVEVKNLRKAHVNVRVGYGHWYDAYAGWQIGANWIDRKKFSRWSVDADWLVDLTTLAYGYNRDRIVSVNGLAGVGIGYLKERKQTSFSPDLHVGGQLRVKLSSDFDIFAEPRLIGRFVTRKTSGKHIMPHFSTQIGVSYYLKDKKKH